MSSTQPPTEPAGGASRVPPRSTSEMTLARLVAVFTRVSISLLEHLFDHIGDPWMRPLPDRGAARTILTMADEEVPVPVPFSDEDMAFLRHVRFGELPARVRPDDLVPLQETDP